MISRPAAVEGEICSPCIDVCRLNPATGLCEGCLRTVGEIAAWSAYSDDEKRAVLALIRHRERAS